MQRCRWRKSQMYPKCATHLFRRTWSKHLQFCKFEVLQRKIMGPRQIENVVSCSLAVNLQLIAAKRAAVKWAERQTASVICN